MERHFHHDLESLRDRLADMAGRAETAITKSMIALRDLDASLAEEIRLEDLEIDRIELEIERSCLAFLGLQQPVARDLRFIVAAIRISNDLERIGDHAVNIAHSAVRLEQAGRGKPLGEDLPQMAEKTAAMLRDSITAWLNGDGALAKNVCERDVEVDSYRTRLFAKLSEAMIKSRESVPRALELLLVSRNLERVADLATNIAEDAIFVAEARVIKHHAEEEHLGTATGSGPSAS